MIYLWDYAKQNNLTIISKDSDFSHRIIVSNPPPKIIHIKIGNMKLKEFNSTIEKLWETAKKISGNYKLVKVFIDRIEAVEYSTNRLAQDNINCLIRDLRRVRV